MTRTRTRQVGRDSTATGDSMINQPIQTYCIGGTRPTEGSDPSWVTKSIDCGPTNAIDENAPLEQAPNSRSHRFR